MDLILSLLSIIILSPLFLILAFFVRVLIGRPIIFKQQRPGLNEKIFDLYKFRTMTNQRDSIGNLLPDEIRLTRFGKFLRSTSLDELPSLLNIVKGDLSIVGPRPLLVEYLDFYNDDERKRHDVRPGLTGLAQIRGRNYMTWETKFKIDLEYVSNLCFVLDAKIFLVTIIKVLTRNNIETASEIHHNGSTYRPLNVERARRCNEK